MKAKPISVEHLWLFPSSPGGKARSVVTLERFNAVRAKANHLRIKEGAGHRQLDPRITSQSTETVARCLGASVACKGIVACSIPLDVEGTVVL